MIRSKAPLAFRFSRYHLRRHIYNARYFRAAAFRVRLPCMHIDPGHLPWTLDFRKHFSATSTVSSIEHRWIDGVERLELYERGGYHPVLIDNLLHNRYRIVDKLGFGGYSTIWLARDEEEKRYVAVKIGISVPTLPRREQEILRALHDSYSISEKVTALPTILDSFAVHGPNGTHPCYILTPAQGNLKEASFSRLFPIQVARALSAKLVTAVAAVHSRGLVHGGQFYSIKSQLLQTLLTIGKYRHPPSQCLG